MEELALHLLDLYENSRAAGARCIWVNIDEDTTEDRLTVMVDDDGPGMDEQMRASVADAFVTTRKTRRVGLGLPLLAQACEQSDGYLKVTAAPRGGTRVVAVFQHSHVDRPPLGDMGGTLAIIVATNPHLDLVYHHCYNGQECVFDTRRMREELDDLPINHPQVVKWVRDTYRTSIQDLRGGEI